MPIQNQNEIILPSTIKTIDQAVLAFFKKFNLTSTKHDGTSKQIECIFIGANRNIIAERSQLRDQGWFPVITIKRTNVNTPDPNTYNLNSESHIRIRPSDFVKGKSQYLQLDAASKNTSSPSKYGYIIPKISMVDISYTIKHISRGKTPIKEANAFIDVLGSYIGTVVRIVDPSTNHKYSLKFPTEINEETNVEDLDWNEEKEMIMSIDVTATGYLVPEIDELGNKIAKKRFGVVQFKFDSEIESS